MITLLAKCERKLENQNKMSTSMLYLYKTCTFCYTYIKHVPSNVILI
jgi:hypothetical protein